jgi:hypothetical protein
MNDEAIKDALADDYLMAVIGEHSVDYLRGYKDCIEAIANSLMIWSVVESENNAHAAEILGALIERKEAIEADELQAQAMGDKWQ